MWKDEVEMCVGCLMLVIIEEFGEILKWCVHRIMVEMIIGVTMRIAVKEISGSRAGIGFKTMIEDLTIEDINSEIEVITAQGAKCQNIGVVELNIRKREFENLVVPCVGRFGIPMYSWDRFHRWIKDHFGLRSEIVGDSRFEDKNSVESVIGEKVNCAIISDLVLSSRDQLIDEQRTDPELGHIYRYLENPEDSSVNATIFENWSRDFRLIEGLLFYAKYATSLGEMRVYIPPKSLRNEIMRELNDQPLAGHFGPFKTYHKIRDVCYFPYMRKFIDEYVSTCHMCQINNHKNALPAGR
ncbi:uncharacterized protein TNCV_1004851 [Trichonephila clavipes]|nr:uncharacterized protein TNCV_1004851 [Trichonephila clavipes]